MQCQKCGWCCSNLIVEITQRDVDREPKLWDYVELLDGNGEIEIEPGLEVYMLTCGKPCPMLKNNKCSIYKTRPDVCRGFEVGSEQCAKTGIKLCTD